MSSDVSVFHTGHCMAETLCHLMSRYFTLALTWRNCIVSLYLGISRRPLHGGNILSSDVSVFHTSHCMAETLCLLISRYFSPALAWRNCIVFLYLGVSRQLLYGRMHCHRLSYVSAQCIPKRHVFIPLPGYADFEARRLPLCH